MESRVIPLSIGWRCFSEAWLLLKKEPIKLIIGAVLWLAIEFGIAFIPIAGPMIDGFIFPMFYAGFLNVSRKVDIDEPIKVSDFFIGFVDYRLLLQLSCLGGFLVGFEILSVIFAESLGAISVAILLPLAVIMISALIFSVPLVLFEKIKFHQALKSSVACCGKNFAVIFVMYFILLAFMVVSAVTFGLGLIVIIPVTFCALYHCYSQAFVAKEAKE